MLNNSVKIKSALISVYDKTGIDKIAEKITNLGIKIYSTGGTFNFLKSKGITVTEVEEVTNYPSIFNGRVKTLHPSILGAILYRRDEEKDIEDKKKYNIPSIDLVIVDLYPFEETVASTNNEEEIVEKIDIGGISLIRAAAKNFNDVVIIPSKNQYSELEDIIENQDATTTLEQRKKLAAQAFEVSSYYDTQIFKYFNKDFDLPVFKAVQNKSNTLRYGENPHQKGVFYGDLNKVFEQLHGKAISYNNLVDIDAAIEIISEFVKDPTFTVIKHTNACGLATRDTMIEAWKCALAGDPVSAFGGIIICNKKLDFETSKEIDKIFFEVIIAPDYEESALEVLKSKKNRIILQLKQNIPSKKQFKSILNGVIEQDKDTFKHCKDSNWEVVSNTKPNEKQINDMLFANIIVKHLKSNAIVIVKDQQLLGAGSGMTSRVDAVKFAINKAKENGFSLQDSVLASDAFFPFSDSVEIAFQNGIKAVIEPGGSIRDKDTIEFCNKNNISIVFTSIRHFKH